MIRISVISAAAIVYSCGLGFASIINIPADYPTIQQGINACNPHDTVLVANGTYYENVWINTEVSLVGEDQGNTIIDASGMGSAVILLCSEILVRNFTLRNSGAGYWKGGIRLVNADSCIIECCNSENNYSGLCLYGSSGNMISRCRFSGNTNGILFCEGWMEVSPDNNSNTIRNNIIADNAAVGVLFDFTLTNHHTSNYILGNRITNNPIGISTIKSQDNLIAYNSIGYSAGFGEMHAMSSGGGQFNQFHHNIFDHNNNDTLQASDIGGGIDYWYSLADSEGNYWSDYTGPDNNGDGIGDIPYDIEGGESQDPAPLMEVPFSSIAGQVTYGTDPIDGVLVHALGTTTFRYTDINGMYTLGPLGAGMYDISFSRALFRDTVVAAVPATLDFTTALDVVMEPQTGIDDEGLPIPEKFALFQNYPNPFNSGTTIRFEIVESAEVKLVIYDLLGRKVRTLIDNYTQAGIYTETFDANDLPSGVYFYRLHAGGKVESRRMLLLK